MPRAAIVACLLLAGCTTPTELVLVIDSDRGVPSELDSVTITINDVDVAAVDVDSDRALPLTLGLRPSADSSEVRVRVTGRAGAEIVAIVETDVQSFAEERREVVYVFLSADGDSQCRLPFREELLEHSVQNACDAPMDAGLDGAIASDAGTMDGGRPDAAPTDGGDIEGGGIDSGGIDSGADGGSDGGPTPDGGLACPAAGALSPPLVHYPFSGSAGTALLDTAPAAPEVLLSPLGAVTFPTGELARFTGTVGQALVGSVAASGLLTNALVGASAFTVETWFQISDEAVEVPGPERVVTLSLNFGNRAFLIGADGTDLIVRLRSSLTESNGIRCNGSGSDDAEARFPAVLSTTQRSHVVLTYDGVSMPRVYVDGVVQTWRYCGAGFTLNWTDAASLQLYLGNERGMERLFAGDIYRVTIYDRGMDTREVTCWYARGSEAPLY